MSGPEQPTQRDLAAAYALDALTPEEARRFEAFMATSPETQREVSEFRDVAAMLALAGPERAERTDLRDRVLRSIGEDQSRRTPSGGSRALAGRGSRTLWVALAASLVAVLGLGAAVLSLRNDLARVEQTLAQRQQDLQSRQATLDAILEPGVELYQLTATGDPEPGVQLFWDRARNRAMVHAYRLKPVPQGRAYQLWFIQDGKPVPSVTFKPEPDGRAKIEQIPVPARGKVSAAAVTVEPETGSPQPTSPILLVGKLGKT